MAEERNYWRWITDVEEFDKFVESLTVEDWLEIERQIREGMDIYMKIVLSDQWNFVIAVRAEMDGCGGSASGKRGGDDHRR